MQTLPPPDPAAPLPEGRFSGREAFQQLVRDAFASAAREGWAEIILSDAYFHDWPLGERAVIESLNAWARRGRMSVSGARTACEGESTRAYSIRRNVSRY